MTNPLKFDPEREERIRTRAYHLWESEGRPHGRAAEFWERASELVAMEESAGAGQLPNPIAEGRDPTALEGVEEAFIQENLGEFPGQLTDQGDVSPVPMARKPRAAAPAPAPTSSEAPAKPKAASKPKPSPKPKTEKPAKSGGKTSGKTSG